MRFEGTGVGIVSTAALPTATLADADTLTGSPPSHSTSAERKATAETARRRTMRRRVLMN
jgi:hypothetical protein